MKAKDILKKYDITRNTLTNWVKSGRISVIKNEKTNRYEYLDSDNTDINKNLDNIIDYLNDVIKKITNMKDGKTINN